jgi:hypothetical protein
VIPGNRANGKRISFFIPTRTAALSRSLAISTKYIPDPTAPGAIEDGFAFAVFECGLEDKRKQFMDDLPLCGPGCFRATPTSAGVLHRQVKGRRSGFVSQRRLTASFEQAFDRGGTARAYGAVQGRGAVFILGINAGSGVEQAPDCPHLPFRIPIGPVDVAIRRVMQWAALTMIRARVWVGTGGE